MYIQEPIIIELPKIVWCSITRQLLNFTLFELFEFSAKNCVRNDIYLIFYKNSSLYTLKLDPSYVPVGLVIGKK